MLLAAIVAAGAWVAWGPLYHAALEARSGAPAGTRVVVAAGAGLRQVLADLARAGAVVHPRWLEWQLRLHGQAPRVQAGTYELAAGASAGDILEQINSGRVVLEQLTIVEGWTFAQMRAAIDADTTLAHDTRGIAAGELMRSLGRPGVDPEGRFFPDTYRYAAGTSDRRIYEQALARMDSCLASEWQARAAGLPVADAQQALVLASIVEKETGREDERARVAAVFVNRLRHGMRLQSDPTVIYGLGSGYDGNIRRRDLEADTPYNTYTRAGLPPTPIALPGAASLRAALHPAPIDALYFVATGLGDGSHHFSASYAEHSRALLDYLKRIGARPDAAARGGG